MRHLIITAHPSSKGFTHKIAKTFLHKAHESGDEAEILDLYNPKYKLDFLKFEDITKLKEDQVVLEIQDKIRLADNIVFVCPIWWAMVPSIMKNFLDRVFTSGFAFRYVKDKVMPEKLLIGKTAQVFMTCDAPGFFIKLIMGNPVKKFYKVNLEFCGIKLKDYLLLSSKRKQSDANLNAFLKKVGKKV